MSVELLVIVVGFAATSVILFYSIYEFGFKDKAL